MAEKVAALEFTSQRGQCSTCGAEVIWVLTQNRKRMPMDAEPVKMPPGQYKLAERDDGSVDAYLVNRVWISHFATCKDSDFHRKETR